MREKIKRWPIVAWFLRLRYPWNSTCLICGLPWSACEDHSIPIDKGVGSFPFANGVGSIRVTLRIETR